MQKIFFILLLLVAQIVYSQQQQMTLEDAVLGRSTYLLPETLNDLSWRNDQVYTWLDEDVLWAEDAGKEGKSVLTSIEMVNEILKEEESDPIESLEGYKWTETEELLLQNEGKFYVLDISSGKISYQIDIPVEASNAVFNEQGKFVAYTINDDLYVSFADGKQVQITGDGGNGIVNGQSVHRNEFGISNGIFPSPAGNYIAYYRMDESMVSEYPVVDYMPRVAELNPIRYPMAGMNSHQVTIGIYNIQSGKTQFLNTGSPFDRYFTNITWAPGEESIYIAELNREQNHLALNSYDIASGEKIQMLFEEKHEAYVEPLHPLLFSKVNSEEFYYLSRRDDWLHVYKYSVKGELKAQLTKGEWETAGILGFSADEKYMFIEAHKESPLELHIYRVDTKKGKIEKLTDMEGVHKGILSKQGSYVIDRFSTPEIPSQTGLISANGKFRRTLHVAGNPLKNYQLGENKLVSVLSADGKTELTGRLILPVDFDSSKKYPVIIYVYGGPHSQLVDKSWLNGANWWQYYMASKGFISFTMDNRGTSNRGREFETSIHRQLGIPETADQMKGVEFLKSLPYVDAERIGVHGWSYGGFMTLNMVLRYPGVFKAGVAGGPVVDWSMYEIMYGERYMDSPQENPGGYEKTNMLNHIENLDDDLMLIHGVQDDVVVMQHSMKFLRECIKREKQVDFFVYPTHPHNVRGKDRVHLMEKISRYFTEKLNQTSDDVKASMN